MASHQAAQVMPGWRPAPAQTATIAALCQVTAAPSPSAAVQLHHPEPDHTLHHPRSLLLRVDPLALLAALLGWRTAAAMLLRGRPCQPCCVAAVLAGPALRLLLRVGCSHELPV